MFAHLSQESHLLSCARVTKLQSAVKRLSLACPVRDQLPAKAQWAGWVLVLGVHVWVTGLKAPCCIYARVLFVLVPVKAIDLGM